MDRKAKSLPPPASKKPRKGVRVLQLWNTSTDVALPIVFKVPMTSSEYKDFSDDPIAYVNNHHYFDPYIVERLIHSRHHSTVPKPKPGNRNQDMIVVMGKGIDCTTFAHAYPADQ